MYFVAEQEIKGIVAFEPVNFKYIRNHFFFFFPLEYSLLGDPLKARPVGPNQQNLRQYKINEFELNIVA